jgi:hypothetical protein
MTNKEIEILTKAFEEMKTSILRSIEDYKEEVLQAINEE